MRNRLLSKRWWLKWEHRTWLNGLKVEVAEEDEAYFNTWIKLFTEDIFLLVKAGTIAQKAVDSIINGRGKNEVPHQEQTTIPIEDEKPKRGQRKRN